MSKLKIDVLRLVAELTRQAEYWRARGREDLARAYDFRAQVLGAEAEQFE